MPATLTNIPDILREHRNEVAIVVGNGVHRYKPKNTSNSWRSLIQSLSDKYLGETIPKTGISLTEIYDLIDLKRPQRGDGKPLQIEFCELMKDWAPSNCHRQLVDWAINNDTPILTTNFDNVLGVAAGSELRYTERRGRTDFYPWEFYYGNNDIIDPSSSFGIWHINGMQHYHRSIRLGLSHYMNSVGRARGWLHKGDEEGLFSGKNIEYWRGYRTWLHVVFNNPLLIFGIGLEENEVFLRWLLIQRARYFRSFENRKQPAWYIHKNEPAKAGKLMFLSGVGVTPVKVGSYDEIYGSHIWKT